MKYIFNRISLASLCILFALNSCDNTPKADNTVDTTAPPASTPTPSPTPSPEPDMQTPQQVPDSILNGKRDTVMIKTTAGTITVALYNETPLHRANFMKLVREHYYDGILFHRVIKDFMIQTGDPNCKNSDPADDGQGGPGYTIPAEIKATLQHKKGALAAARNDNPEKASSGSQFYICHIATPQLDGQYTVFGETIAGQDIVDKIAMTPTAPGDRPLKDIKIISTTVKGEKPAAKVKAQ